MAVAEPIVTRTRNTEDFFNYIYGDDPPGYQIIVSINKQTNKTLSYSFPAAGGLGEGARKVSELSKNPDLQVYFTVGLQGRAMARHERGIAAGVVAIPGFWFDLDIKGPGHAKEDLPATLEEALEFARTAFPLKPSIIIHSGGGIYPVWLFRELWQFESREEWQEAADLSRRLHRTLRAKGKEYGWNLDNTSPLSQVLRPPGAFNNKLDIPRKVIILEDTRVRYNPEDFEPYLPETDLTEWDGTTGGDFPPVKIEPIVGGCQWMKHCYEDQANLPEHEWYYMLSVIGRCENGQELAHEWSKGHPKYSHRETQGKLEQALKAAGPVTCTYVKECLNDGYCHECKAGVKSPVVLGLPKRGLPQIVINNRYLPTITRESIEALDKKNHPPILFDRSGEIVKVAQIWEKNRQNQAVTRPVIKPLNESALRGYLARSADYVRMKKVGGDFQAFPDNPPLEVVRDIFTQDNLPLPLLRGITEAPIMREDGSVNVTPGYDTVTSLYFAPEHGFNMPEIPDKPTAGDIQTALNKLDDIIIDFPFDGAASRANMLAAILTPVLRDLIPGPVPMQLIDKPLQGTGASLLSDVNAIISTGKPAFMTTAPEGRQKEEEWRKRITSLLVDGRPLVVIDNIEGAFQSANLCAVLTSTNWSDRVLGRNELINLQHRTCWIATGNNIRLAGDLPRRCYKVRLDAESARPWQRDPKQFKHPQLLRFVKENRGELLAAIFTLARGWIIAGRPAPKNIPVMGSFEEWREVIGGILEFTGVKDFLGNLNELYESAETDEGIEVFLEGCFDIWDDKCFTTKEVRREIDLNPNLGDLLPAWLDPEEKGFTRKLGNLFARKAGAYFTNGLQLVRDGESHRALLWRIVKPDDDVYTNEELPF